MHLPTIITAVAMERGLEAQRAPGRARVLLSRSTTTFIYSCNVKTSHNTPSRGGRNAQETWAAPVEAKRKMSQLFLTMAFVFCWQITSPGAGVVLFGCGSACWQPPTRSGKATLVLTEKNERLLGPAHIQLPTCKVFKTPRALCLPLPLCPWLQPFTRGRAVTEWRDLQVSF